MKTRAFLLSLIPALFLFSCGPTHVVVETAPAPAPPAPPPAPPPITYQTFYDELSPYGQWVDYPNLGYVWIPNVEPGFKPYGTAGHWVYADAGWTWVSDYSWGWAPFHYGRWFFDDNYGWCWVPGYQWAPAWVTWRRSDDYYGWAPLAPEVGVSVTIDAYNPPVHAWCFVPRQYVASPHVNNYYMSETRNVTIVNNTTIINNYNRNAYAGGPDRGEVEAVTHSSIRPVTFRESQVPGGSQENGGQLAIYRPAVRTAPAAGGRPAPARIVPFHNQRTDNRAPAPATPHPSAGVTPHPGATPSQHPNGSRQAAGGHPNGGKKPAGQPNNNQKPKQKKNPPPPSPPPSKPNS